MRLRRVVLAALLIGKAGTAADHTVTVEANTVVRTLPANYHGVNYVAFWDNQQGSVGSREALRRAGVQLIRYPGGVPGNLIDWAKISGSWAGTNTDTLWNYARAVGAKLLLQTNPFANRINDAGTLNDSSGRHAAEWVTYCRDRSIDAPLWEIGNEPEGEAPINWDYPAKDSVLLRRYLTNYNEQAPAVRAASSSITVMGPSSANSWYWWAQGLLEVFLRNCDHNADAVSLHWYGDGSTYDAIVGFAQVWYSCMNFIRGKTQKPLYITEWNNHGSTGNINTTLGNALVNADVIGVFARTGVAGHTFFGCIHGATNGGYGAWGILYGSGESKPLDTPTPSYFILPLWTRMGQSVLKVVNPADTVKTLTAYAHKKTDGSVQVMLINKSTRRTVEVRFTGLDPTGKTVRTCELRGANGLASDESVVYNGTLDPHPATEDLPAPTEQACPGSSVTVNLAGYSITLLDFLPITDPAGLSIVNFTASPDPIWNNAATTVTFTAEARKVGGTIASATLDLSALGGGSAVTMQPGAAPGAFTHAYTVARGIAAGAKTVTLTVRDNTGNTRTSTVSISVKAPKSEFIIYTDASSIAGSGWAGHGTLTEVSSGAFEGTKCWDYSFTVADGWAGCGILLYTWGTTLDLSGYKSIRFAYKGAAASMAFQYVGGATSQSVPINASANWVTVELPLSSFGSANPVDCINIMAGGSNGTSGHVYIDDIRLVPETPATANHRYVRGALPDKPFGVSPMPGGIIIGAPGNGRLRVINSLGQVVAAKTLGGEREIRIGLRGGVYVVELDTGAMRVVRHAVVK